jgi:hypothetical protein
MNGGAMSGAKSPTLTDHEFKTLSAYDASLLEQQKACDAQKTAILDRVRQVVTANAYEEILEVIADSDFAFDFSIDSSYRGEYQEALSCGPYWVDETVNGGMSGDDYGGTVSIKIGLSQYLTFHYTM